MYRLVLKYSISSDFSTKAIFSLISSFNTVYSSYYSTSTRVKGENMGEKAPHHFRRLDLIQVTRVLNLVPTGY